MALNPLRFFFRKRYRPPAYPRPRWMHVVMAVFFIYAGYKSFQKSTPQHPNPVNETVENVGQQLSGPALTQTLDVYKNIFFPKYSNAMDIEDVAAGNGQPLVCGQQATIAYKTKLVDGPVLPYQATSDAPFVFRLGEGKAIPAIEQGATGMRVGAKRRLIAPASMSYGVKPFSKEKAVMTPGQRVQIDMELISSSPEVPDMPNSAYRIAHVDEDNKGMPIYCGERATVQLTIWNLAGEKIYSTRDKGEKPLSFTPGKSEVFFGLEQGVIGLPILGKRMLVVPPAFQKPVGDGADKLHFSFPEGQTVLVDVEALP